MTEEEVEDVRKVDKLTAFIVVIIFISFGAGVVATSIIMQPDDDPPEYDDITVRSHDRAIAEQLNQIALTLNEIRDRDTDDYSLELAEMEYVLFLILEDTSIIVNRTPHPDLPVFPDDMMDFEWVSENLTFQLLFYDNHLKMDRWSPIFEADNWSYMVMWAMSEVSEHNDIFTQTQKDYLLLIAINLAYYKETGIWLGD
jgi:hypothetical protein